MDLKKYYKVDHCLSSLHIEWENISIPNIVLSIVDGGWRWIEKLYSLFHIETQRMFAIVPIDGTWNSCPQFTIEKEKVGTANKMPFNLPFFTIPDWSNCITKCIQLV